jgi:hypothetical protein
MANWWRALGQSLIGYVHFLSALRSESRSSFNAASSVGKWPRVLMILLSWLLTASIEFVV